MLKWLMLSILGSIILTVGFNRLSRLFSSSARRVQRKLGEQSRRCDDQGQRVRAYVPWKAMLIGSIVLTALVNLIAFALRR